MKTFCLTAIAFLSVIVFSCENPDIFVENLDVADENLDCSRTDKMVTASAVIEYNFKKQRYYNIDQSMRISELAPDTSLLVNVHFDGDTQGYFGFRSDENGKTQITFSMTNATGCSGFQPVGSSCEDKLNGTMEVRLDHEIALNHEYRLRIWTLQHPPGEDTRWGVFIKDITKYPTIFENITDENGTEEGVIYVGSITARNATVLTGGTTYVNFDGFAYTNMDCMPQTKAYFSTLIADHNDPTRSFLERAIIGSVRTDTLLNTTFKRVTLDGIFEGVEITTGGG